MPKMLGLSQFKK